MEKNYAVMNVDIFKDGLTKKGRIMAGTELGLTGCEISFNYSQAENFVPFVHSHKLNEEVYIILSGNGKFSIDGDEIDIQEGSVVRIAPAGKRAIKAGNEDLIYVCIQAQAGSLTQATMEDGVISESKASWM